MKDSAQFLPFQLNYRFVCKCCNYPTWTESFRLAKSSWIESVLSAQSHLMWKTQRDIFRVAEVADFVEHNWHLLCVDELRDTSSASANLSNGSKPPLPQQGGDLAVVESPLSTCGGASPSVGGGGSGGNPGGIILVEKDQKDGKWRDSFNSYWTTHEHRYFTRPERGYWGIKTHHDLALAAAAAAAAASLSAAGDPHGEQAGGGNSNGNGNGHVHAPATALEYTPEEIEEEEQLGPAMQPCRIFREAMPREKRRRGRGSGGGGGGGGGYSMEGDRGGGGGGGGLTYSHSDGGLSGGGGYHGAISGGGGDMRLTSGGGGRDGGGVSPRAAGSSPRGNYSPRSGNSHGRGGGGKTAGGKPHGGGGGGRDYAGNGGGGGLRRSSSGSSRPSLYEAAARDRELYSKPEAPSFKHSGSSGSRPSSSRRRKQEMKQEMKQQQKVKEQGSSPRASPRDKGGGGGGGGGRSKASAARERNDDTAEEAALTSPRGACRACRAVTVPCVMSLCCLAASSALPRY